MLSYGEEETTQEGETLERSSASLELAGETWIFTRREGLQEKTLRFPLQGANHQSLICSLVLARKLDLSKPTIYRFSEVDWPDAPAEGKADPMVTSRDIVMTVPKPAAYMHRGKSVQAYTIRAERGDEATILVVDARHTLLAFWPEGSPLRLIAGSEEEAGKDVAGAQRGADSKSPFAACALYVRVLSKQEPLDTLDKKARPEHTALLVIDVQNDFCADAGIMAEEGFDVSQAQAMAARLPPVLSAARAAGVLVVFVRNVYSSEHNFYLSDAWLEQASRRRAGSYTRRPVCRAGTWEGDFYGDVRPEPCDPVVTKHRFNAFRNTDLDTILRAHGVRTIVMTGVATNVCVETTARDGFMRDYYVVFTDDGTAAYAEEDHQATLRNIDRFFGQVVQLADLQAIWMSNDERAAD